MTLTVQNRADLEALGPATVRFKLLQGPPNRSAPISGFKHGNITLGDIEDWLVEKETSVRKNSNRQFWAMIILTAIAAIAACIAAWPVLRGS